MPRSTSEIRAATPAALAALVVVSLGCVEMPLEFAGSVFPYTPIGTLVTVVS